MKPLAGIGLAALVLAAPAVSAAGEQPVSRAIAQAIDRHQQRLSRAVVNCRADGRPLPPPTRAAQSPGEMARRWLAGFAREGAEYKAIGEPCGWSGGPPPWAVDPDSGRNLDRPGPRR